MFTIRSNFVKFLLLAFCCVVPAWIAWLPDYEGVKYLAFKWNYWFAAAIYAAFVVFSHRALRSVGAGGIKGWFRVNRIGLVSSLILAMFLQINEPHRAKVLCDEGVICGVAYEMHYERIAAFPTSMHNIEGKMAIMHYTVDKRPIGYPFVLSTFHDLTGYRYANVFILNGILGFVFILLLYLFAKPMIGEKGAVAVQLLMCTLPLLAQNVTSAGFEVFNLCMILAFMLAARRYLAKSGSDGLNLFIAVTLVLSIARYESALYLTALAVIVIFKWTRERRVSLSWFSILSPLLLMSSFLSFRIFMGNSEFFQENYGEFLSISHLGGNLMSAYRFMTDLPWGGCPNSLLLGIVGVISTIAFVCYLFRSKTRTVIGDTYIVVIPVLAAASINTFIGLVENMGQWDSPGAARFALPIHLMFAICFAGVLPVFLKSRQVPLVVPVVFGAWMIFVGSFQMARHNLTNRSPFSLEFEYFRDWAEKNATQRDLFVMDLPAMMIISGYPCSSINAINEYTWKFKNVLDEGIYDNVYICETLSLDPGCGWTNYYECCPKGYPKTLKCDVLSQTRIRPGVMVKISRLVGIDVPEADKHGKPSDPALYGKWFSDSLP